LKKIEENDELPLAVIKELGAKLEETEVTEKELDLLIEEAKKSYLKVLVEPGEAVGTIAAQSIGEPGTQMSIPGTENVIVKSNDHVNIVEIGDFVDNLFSNAEITEHIGESEVLNLEYDDYRVPCVGQDEKTHWRRLRQVSRHPVNGELLKITTRSGRKIEATLSHSFLMRDENKIIPVTGRSLKVGDRIPLIKHLQSDHNLESIPVERYIPKHEAWYGSEFIKARRSWDRLGRHWKEEYNVAYTVPVKEDDLRIAFKTRTAEMLTVGHVYPKAFSNTDIQIPETFQLNYLFGWFLGAYIAEGSNAGSYVSITNIDENYQNRVQRFANELSISWRLIEETGEFGPSVSVCLSSSLLAKLLARMCGKNAPDKFVPDWALNAPEEFVSGLLQAYFDGDGSFSVERMQIRASSKSKALRDGICLLLSRFGILASKQEDAEQYNLRIPGKYALVFKDKIGPIIPHKRDILDQMVTSEENKEITYDIIDMIPGFGKILNNLRIKLKIDAHSSLAASIRKYTTNQVIGRQTLARYVKLIVEEAKKKNIDISNEINTIQRALESDVIWDQITSIELVKSPTSLVYDFSVEQHENFTTAEGLITHNTLRTFHYAGVAELNVTLGLPRLIEIVDARKNPSTPMMTVFLDDAHKEDGIKAREVARRIEETKIEKVTYDIEINLSNMQIDLKLDPDLMDDKGLTAEFIVEKINKLKKGDAEIQDDYTIIVRPKIDNFTELQKLAEKIRSLPLKGLKDVKRTVIRKEEEEFVIYSEGTNLLNVLRVSGVHPMRTISNHIHEIAECLGIEAARNIIIAEAINVLEEQGLDVDLRHVMLVADLMTVTGEVRQIGRHGISGEKASVLARAAFEVTVKHLLEASTRGEIDHLKGITENVIIGQTILLGTGAIDLMMSREGKKKAKEDKE